jgi:hypothetical protein
LASHVFVTRAVGKKVEKKKTTNRVKLTPSCQRSHSTYSLDTAVQNPYLIPAVDATRLVAASKSVANRLPAYRDLQDLLPLLVRLSYRYLGHFLERTSGWQEWSGGG